jgi:serine/threonine protein kinase
VAKLHENGLLHCDIKPSNVAWNSSAFNDFINYADLVAKWCFLLELLTIKKGKLFPLMFFKCGTKEDIRKNVCG